VRSARRRLVSLHVRAQNALWRTAVRARTSGNGRLWQPAGAKSPLKTPINPAEQPISGRGMIMRAEPAWIILSLLMARCVADVKLRHATTGKLVVGEGGEVPPVSWTPSTEPGALQLLRSTEIASAGSVHSVRRRTQMPPSNSPSTPEDGKGRAGTRRDGGQLKPIRKHTRWDQ